MVVTANVYVVSDVLSCIWNPFSAPNTLQATERWHPSPRAYGQSGQGAQTRTHCAYATSYGGGIHTCIYTHIHTQTQIYTV